MAAVGTVVQVWRYPVKSFQGEQVESLDLGPGGASGDRTLAVVDPAAQKVLSGKRYPDLLMASARVEGGGVVLTLPGGTEHRADDPGVHEALSSWLDHEVRLEPPPTEGVYPMEAHTGMSDESSPVFDWPGPQGTWLDLADAHWLTTASLAATTGASGYLENVSRNDNALANLGESRNRESFTGPRWRFRGDKSSFTIASGKGRLRFSWVFDALDIDMYGYFLIFRLLILSPAGPLHPIFRGFHNVALVSV